MTDATVQAVHKLLSTVVTQRGKRERFACGVRAIPGSRPSKHDWYGVTCRQCLRFLPPNIPGMRSV